jgi:hypothetical protein
MREESLSISRSNLYKNLGDEGERCAAYTILRRAAVGEKSSKSANAIKISDMAVGTESE